MRAGLVIAAALLAGGCGGAATDPASEAPVDLQPGLYDVIATGGTLMEVSPGRSRDQLCLSHDQAQQLPSYPMENVTRHWRGCKDTYQPRKGNAFGGHRVCPRTSRRLNKALADYTGHVTPDSFVMTGDVRVGEDGKGFGNGHFTLRGKRIGDC